MDRTSPTFAATVLVALVVGTVALLAPPAVADDAGTDALDEGHALTAASVPVDDVERILVARYGDDVAAYRDAVVAAELAAFLESLRPPPAVVASAGTGRAPSPVPPRATGAALDAIRQCESGGDYGAISPGGTYRGAYQFDQQTWNGVGGTGDPAAASPDEQDLRAGILYEQRGAAPWPVCGQ